MKRVLSVVLLFSLAGCVSTKMTIDYSKAQQGRPTYEDYFDYYWWGLAHKNTVDVQQVCMDQKPLAIREMKTFDDFFLTFFTLGIYSPLTVQVWCGEGT